MNRSVSFFILAVALFIGFHCNGQLHPYLKSGHISPVTHLCFSDDGKFLASTDASGKTILWDFFTHTELNNYNNLGNAAFPVRMVSDSMALLNNNEWWNLKTNSRDKNFLPTQQGNNDTGRCEITKKGNLKIRYKNNRIYIVKGIVTNYSLSKDNRMIGHFNGDHYVFIRNASHPNYYQTLNMDQNICAIAFHPALPNILAIGLTDGSIYIADIRSKKKIFTLGQEMITIANVSRSANGKTMEIKGPHTCLYLSPETEEIKSYDVAINAANQANYLVYLNNEGSEMAKTTCFTWNGNAIKYTDDDTRYTIKNFWLGNTFMNNLHYAFIPYRFMSSFLDNGLASDGSINNSLPEKYSPGIGFKYVPQTGLVYYNVKNAIIEHGPNTKNRYHTGSHFSYGQTGYFDVNEHYIVSNNIAGNIVVYGLLAKKYENYIDTTVYKSDAYLRKTILLTGCDSFIIQYNKDHAFFTIFSLAPKLRRVSTFNGVYLNDDKGTREYYSVDGNAVTVHSYDNTETKKIKAPRNIEVTNVYPLMKGNAVKDYLVFYSKGLADIATTNGTLIATYYFYTNGDYIILTPDNYFFTSSKTLLSKVIMTDDNGHTYTLDQFEAFYNRPDIVLKRIGLADSSLIEEYTAAHELFIQSDMGDMPASDQQTYAPPIATITDWNDSLKTADSSITCHVHFECQQPITSINVYNNNYPILGERGLDLDDRKVKIFDTVMDIPLLQGDNYVKPVCIQSNNQKNFIQTYFIKADYNSNKKIYFLGIGANNYSDAGHDLKYAAKDIRDIASCFSKLYGSDCIIDTLLNDKVTKEEIAKAFYRLQKTGRNDKVFVCYSGHGILSSNNELFLGTYNSVFSNPSLYSFSYKELETQLGRIPAYRKALLIDACNSGALYSGHSDLIAKTRENADQPVHDDKIAARGVNVMYNNSKYENFDLMQDTYADYSQGNGSIIISAARGDQYALEGDKWNNGAFTYSLLQGLLYSKADINHDNEITITELKNYISHKVEEITDGHQKPTYRKDNLDYDWRVR